MFALAFSIGVFSYSIFLLGLLGLLYKAILIPFTFIFWIGFFYYKRNSIKIFFHNLHLQRYSLFFLVCLVLLLVQAIINSVGVFGPEIGFDALWYHLTLPKLYLQYNTIFHIPGGIFFYSDMPKLTEMLYTAGLAFSSDIPPKATQFLFGILCCIALYKVARKLFSPSWAILVPLIFYSNLVVGWESVSAYIDLSRTFFEIMALWAFVIWTQTKKQEWFVKAAVLVGLTVTTKLLAGGTVIIYLVVLFFYEHTTTQLLERLKRIVMFAVVVLLIPLPWLVFSFVHTGNPFYPLFSRTLPLVHYEQVFTPWFFASAIWNTFAYASDPIHPLYLIAIPFITLNWKKLMHTIPLILCFAIGGFVVWYFTPQSGGGRYILPYLPLFTIVVVSMISLQSQNWKRVFIGCILLCSILSIGYRVLANYKFIPVITGRETKAHFLSKHLDFILGDFYDVDSYFATHIKPTDKVLLYGFHNLYYVDFPYIDSTWAEKGQLFNYVAVQGSGMPERFKFWNLVYFNTTTKVRLYTLSGKLWRF